jgi:hypothetical protein
MHRHRAAGGVRDGREMATDDVGSVTVRTRVRGLRRFSPRLEYEEGENRDGELGAEAEARTCYARTTLGRRKRIPRRVLESDAEDDVEAGNGSSVEEFGGTRMRLLWNRAISDNQPRASE